MVLGALDVILDALGSSVLEVHFERILKRSQTEASQKVEGKKVHPGGHNNQSIEI
tara:strand:- start:118 stop:282 length:165 start_codon:yes stop_codon:yes gene_type:complete